MVGIGLLGCLLWWCRSCARRRPSAPRHRPLTGLPPICNARSGVRRCIDRSGRAMKNEVLCKFLCHNICCLIMRQCELGIEPVFWADEKAGQAKGEPTIVPMVRPG